ncbi:FAD-dependent oxidoreductase [Paenibacillus sp. FSL H8-0034]|uniref:FAD-dependent oxidoreductase n=1 Tax=Paenibacillus sp. FSL H8-0034 TaxID=2954671 RepID=UPI0030F5C7B5
MNHPTNESVIEKERKLEIAAYYDTIVCGGGPAGIAAAISAARNGARTLLIELSGCLGGIWTSGNLSIVLDGGGKEGIFRELLDRLEQEQAYLPTGYKSEFTYDAETMKLLLEQMCMNEGVDIQLHTRVVETVTTNRHIDAVVTEGHSGRRALRAKVYIDATGSGDLAASAGCSYETGHPVTGKTQPASMLAIISGVPKSQENTSVPSKHQEFREFLRTAGIEPSYQSPCIFRLPHPDLCFIMMNHEYGVKCDSTEDITNATVNGRKEIYDAVKLLREVPDWEEVRLVSTSSHIGIREGRRITGLYKLSAEDLRQGRKFEDGICLVRFQVDIHALQSHDKIGYSNENVVSKPYQIPYRSLVAMDIDNLGLAGRNVSGDFWAHASYRVTGNSVPMGEAIGFAAATAAKLGCRLDEVSGSAVSEYMSNQGYEL